MDSTTVTQALLTNMTPDDVACIPPDTLDALRRALSVQAPQSPELLTETQAAKLAHVNVETIRRNVRSGELPAVHVGRVIRIRPADFDDWLSLRPAHHVPRATVSRRRRSHARPSTVDDAWAKIGVK